MTLQILSDKVLPIILALVNDVNAGSRKNRKHHILSCSESKRERERVTFKTNLKL